MTRLHGEEKRPRRLLLLLSVAAFIGTLFFIGIGCTEIAFASFTLRPPAAISQLEPFSEDLQTFHDPTDPLEKVNRLAFQHTNRVRAEHNLSPLKPDSGLKQVACAHSRDMLFRGFFSHENPDDKGPSDRVSRIHRRLIGRVGENIWGKTNLTSNTTSTVREKLAERIVEEWMDSPSHRETLLHSSFTHLGVCG